MNAWIICGLVGGAAPSLINLAGHLTTNFDGVGLPGVGYWLGVLIYALIGLVGAAYFANRTPGEAIKAGIVAPALFLSFLNGASSLATSQHSVAWLFGTNAYAQDATAGVSTDNTKDLFLSFDSTAKGKTVDLQSTPPTLDYLLPDGSKKSLALSGDNMTSVAVPVGVQSATVNIGQVSKTFDLPSTNAFVDVNVGSTTQSFQQDFLLAITGKVTSSADSISVDVKPLSSN